MFLDSFREFRAESVEILQSREGRKKENDQ